MRHCHFQVLQSLSFPLLAPLLATDEQAQPTGDGRLFHGVMSDCDVLCIEDGGNWAGLGWRGGEVVGFGDGDWNHGFLCSER